MSITVFFLNADNNCTETSLTIERQVSSENDDAEERVSDGDMYRDSSDLEMTQEDYQQIVGIRFRDLYIPKGAIITNAYIQFTADETDSKSTNLTIYGQDINNASEFSNSDYDISSRTKTTASLSWSPPKWKNSNEQGSKQQTGNLTAIVQEIINRDGWSSGNAMAFIISGTGKRVADAYNGGSNKAPYLHIEFMGCEEDNNNSSTAICFAMTDDNSKVYKVLMSPNSNPLPTPITLNIPMTFDGEGSAYRASNNMLYAFDEHSSSSDLYNINLTTGATSEIKSSLLNGSVEGAEFYFDPTQQKEILYITSEESNSKLYAFYADTWISLLGYPKNIHGSTNSIDSLAIDPVTGKAYASDDYEYDGISPNIHELNLKTGETTFKIQVQGSIDAEGLAYASDGNLYVEDEGYFDGRKIYKIDLQTGELTPSAFLGGSGDVEGISCNGTQMAIEYPIISIDSNSSVVEGNTSTVNLNFLVTLSKPAVENVILNYTVTDETTTVGEDYIAESNLTILIPKGSSTATITIRVKGDTKVESDERLLVSLVDATNAVIGTSSLVGTIINDDERPAPELIADYHFDECFWDGTADEVKDSSGVYGDGTATNTTTIKSEIINRAGYFKDRAEKVTIPHNSDIVLNSDLTISLWIKPEEFPNSPQSLISKSATKELDLEIKNGYIYFRHQGKAFGHQTEQLTQTDRWYHIIVTRDMSSKTVRYYIDSSKVFEESFSDRDIHTSDNDIVIAKFNGNAHSFLGAIDEVKIYNGALSDLNISNIYTNELSHKNYDGTPRETVICPSDITPIAEYRFDECIWNGTTDEVKDGSENGIHGKAKNGTITANDGRINRGGRFIQSDEQYIEINGFDNIFGTSSREFTLTTWIKPNSLSTAETNHKTKNTFFAKASDSKNDNIEIGINPNGTLHLYLDTKTKDTQEDFGNSGDITLNQWHFIAVSYKDGVIQVTIDDNNYTNSSTWSGATLIDQAIGSPVTIGASIHINNYFDGFIDEVKVFEKKLTFTEIDLIKNENEIGREEVICEEFYSLSGKVYQDDNENGSFDGADSGIANVEVKLIRDMNGNGIFDNGVDIEQDSMSSDATGGYNFTNLSTGYYFVSINSEDEHIPLRYILNSDTSLIVNLTGDSSNHNFAFIKESVLPINCVENGLMFQNQPTDISYLDLSSGIMLVEKEDISYNNINGAGYNKKDGYYWGYNYSKGDGTISRIGQDSSGELVVDHFKIPNLNISSYTGDIDDNGHFYIKETGNSKKVAVIDLDPESYTYLQKIRNFNLDEHLNVADWGFNPQDDKLYAVNNGNGVNYLYKIEPSDGTIISKQDTNLTGRSYGFGASFFDKNGFYYIYDNGSGAIFRIDVDENPIPVPFATGGTVSLNDGAMCTDIEIRFDFGDLPDNYPTTLEKDGARHRIKTSVGETHYLGEDVTTENNGKPSTSATRDEYDDGVKVGEVSLQGYIVNVKTDISNLTIKTHGDGYLNAWIDWDRDGDFNLSEQIADSIDGSSGVIDLTINPDDIPQIYFNGEPIYARFRYSSVSELNATGVAPDGEVEDYAIMIANHPDIHIEGDITKVEGDNGETTEFTFRVSLDRTGTNPMTNMMDSGFYFNITDKTATLSDSDYSLPVKVDGSFMDMDSFVMVLPNQDYVDITVLVNGDTKVEQNEEFVLNLYSPSFMNIRNNSATGTIINDDVLILNIERTNSTDELPQSQKESLYTQISGRDFNYAIVSYDKNSNEHEIGDVTIKVELIDNNSSVPDEVIYKEYHYISAKTARVDITDSNDLTIPRASRDARYRISFLADENGSMIQGDFASELEYNATKSINNNGEISYSSRDNFAIRPASFRIEIVDMDEHNNSVNYRINDINHTTPLNLVAEHEYQIEVKATKHNSEDRTLRYRQSLPNELNISLIFEDKSTCNDRDNHKLPYRFNNGQISEIFSHYNTGKYALKIEDNLWTAVDIDFNGCLVNDSTISENANEKSGCNISSNFDTTHHDINFHFQPFKFDLNNTFLNINSNGKNYLYMSDLTLSREMGVKLSSTIRAEGEKGIVLSNFTNSCIDDNVSLSLGMQFSFLSDLGLFDRTNYSPPRSISGEILSPQQIVEFNGETNDSVMMMSGIDISKKFLDENHGIMSLDVIYNMEKLFEEPTNPIKVNFISLDLNTTNLEAQIDGDERLATGNGSIDENRTFYFARVVSYLKYYPETDKKIIETPLFAEIFCKVVDNKKWCDEDMNLEIVGKDIGQKTDRGWYLAKEHDSATDGRVIGLVSNNPMISTNYLVSTQTFIEGRINGISTNYVPDTDISGEETAEIAIDTDIWLRFNKRAIVGMPLGTSSYSVTIKGVSSTTGAGDAGNLMQSVHRIEHNGKMTW